MAKNAHDTPSSLSSLSHGRRRGEIHRRRIISSDSISQHVGGRAMVVVTNLVQPSCSDDRDVSSTVCLTVDRVTDHSDSAEDWTACMRRPGDVTDTGVATFDSMFPNLGGVTSLVCNCSIPDVLLLSDTKFTRLLLSSACKISVSAAYRRVGSTSTSNVRIWWAARSTGKS